MPTSITPTRLTPLVKVTWTANYKGTSTVFRLVMNDSASGGSYTIETKTTDATGKAAWTEFVTVETDTSDQTQTKMTPKVLCELFDALYTT